MHNRMLLLILLISGVFSSPVSQTSAERVARNLFIERGFGAELNIISIQSISDRDMELYHIFHLTPVGFIIVSADDRSVPILGYSFENNYLIEGQPANIKYLMNSFKADIKNAIDNNLESITVENKQTETIYPFKNPNKKPKTLIELNEISGIGQNMLEQYGKELLEIIGP